MKIIKTADIKGKDIVVLFVLLNPEVSLKKECSNIVLSTDKHPRDLVYPEGWFYSHGTLTNKGNSSTGKYYEMKMLKKDGSNWADTFPDCLR